MNAVVEPGRERRGTRIEVIGVSKRYAGRNGVLALDGISLDIAAGELVCMVGPSGCGKSTLLHLIAGLDRPDAGEILDAGVPVREPGRHRLMMFQESALFPWLNVLGNVLFGLKLIPGMSNRERREIALEHLRMVGLERFAQSYAHELSGGMKQRVALARSLAPNPGVLLMDEPFAALDAMTRERLYGDLQRIWADQGKTIIFVTHNVREAVCLGDRVVLLSPRPGRIREQFRIRLPRPRDINSVELANIAREITSVLKTHRRPDEDD